MNSPHRDYAAVAAAQIVNTLSADVCKAELFGRIERIILDAMWLADAELASRRLEPSLN